MAWISEQELLAAIDGWMPLPGEDDARWDDIDSPDSSWADAERLIAAADASGEHGWRDVAIRVFELAAEWDLNGMMRSIRHGPERAFSTYDQAGCVEFASRLKPLSVHERAGTRLWVFRELGILRQLSSLQYLLDRTRDDDASVVEEALISIEMPGQRHPQAQADALRLRD